MARPNAPRSIGAEDNLAERIARERQLRGWSYETLAERMTNAGCSIQGSAIYKIEKGNPRRRITVDELLALAHVFEVTLDDLLTPMDELDDAMAGEMQQRFTASYQRLLQASVDLVADLAKILALYATNREVFDYVTGHVFGDSESPEDWVDEHPWFDPLTGKTEDVNAVTLAKGLQAYNGALMDQAQELAVAKVKKLTTRWGKAGADDGER